MSLRRLEVLRPAAGGSAIAYDDGATVFVRGALPGETVLASVVGAKRGGKVRFADAESVVGEPSPDRVAPPCPVARACGGCDLQHVSRDGQLRWKARVLADQLQRIGGVAEVAGVPVASAVRVSQASGEAPEGSGLAWRCRATLHTDSEGRAGFFAHRSRRVVAAGACPVLDVGLREALTWTWPADGDLLVAVGDAGEPMRVAGGHGSSLVSLPEGWRAGGRVAHTVEGRTWRLPVGGFWQAHRGAAGLLVSVVASRLGPAAGGTLLDLYSGAGLLAAAGTGQVHCVESDGEAVRAARRAWHDRPQVRVHEGDVSKWLQEWQGRAEAVVMDPPRAGAGPAVVGRVSRLAPDRIVYVACDGAALARDAREFARLGWDMASVDAFDLFPMSHHVEAVAVFRPAQ